MNIEPEVYAIGAALVGAIGTLWRIVIRRAHECEKKHEKTQGELLVVTKEVGELKGRVQIAEQIGPKLDSIQAAIESKDGEGKDG
jgi:hypothetical protein